MEQLVKIELFGQNYTFKTESDAVKAQKVVDLLANEVAKVETEQSSQSLSMSKFAILVGAALNITSDKVELKRNYSELQQHLTKKSANLIHVLDSIVE